MILLSITIIFLLVQGVLLFIRNLRRMRHIIVFLTFCFGLTFLFDLLVLYPQVELHGYGTTPLVTALVALTMFIPSLSVVLTRWVMREGFEDVWLRPNLKGNMRHYLLAWLLPPALVAVGAVVYFLCFPSQYAPSAGGIDGVVKVAVLVGSVLLAPVLNCIACLGEEWGWRGYLLPKTIELLRFEERPSCIKLIGLLVGNGVIWGLWHAPLIAVGHNYGTLYPGAPWTGIATMCLFTFSVGTLLAYLCWRTRSCWPGVIGHGAINGIASAALLFSAGGANPHPLLGPSATGLIGGSGLLLGALVVIVLWHRAMPKPLTPQPSLWQSLKQHLPFKHKKSNAL